MATHLAANAVVNTSCHLSLVPDRRVERCGYVPPGRSLHLLDLENLMGGPYCGARALESASDAYRRIAPVGVYDHVIVAANRHLIFDAARCWPGSQALVGDGPDGADLALISAASNVAEVARRFDRIVIGSGDGIFHSLATRYGALGLEVGVVATPSGLAHVLARQASFVRFLPEAPRFRIVA